MFGYANPTKFMRLSGVLLPWLGIGSAVLMLAGLYYALVASPQDEEMGHNVRIMDVHVPAAWMAMFTFVFMAGSSLFGFVWRHHLADMAAKSAAPVGAAFCALCLVTGSLWGIRGWGTWWVWDARLTSELVLLFLYFGYMALRAAIEDENRADRASALLAIIGVINVPIIKYSVEWWHTLHQTASISKLGKPSMPPDMYIWLVMMIVGFMCFFGALLMIRTRAEVIRRSRDQRWLRDALGVS